MFPWKTQIALLIVSIISGIWLIISYFALNFADAGNREENVHSLLLGLIFITAPLIYDAFLL